ncbi:MAG TPA: hypothetical protein VK939_10085 [Longimicrobiales bacterium]|nr:hypothetical protein [Longimicrobiales bacterium]
MATEVFDGGTAIGRLLARARELDDALEPERRHEVLMERAEARDGMERAEAEAVYALAEEEGLEPELALLLAGSGVGVIELEQPDSDPERLGRQQAPPDWVAEADVPAGEALRERRLRLSFRRLRSLLEETGSASEAVHRLAHEPDVAEGAW